MLTDFSKIINENAFSVIETTENRLGVFSAYYNEEDSRIVLKIDLPSGLNYTDEEIQTLIEDVRFFLRNLNS